MANVALLNPGSESRVCQEMLAAAMARKTKLDSELTANLLDRETYLLKIGAAMELKRLIDEMQQVYDREFKV